MAVRSGTMYNTKTGGPSLISSNMYCGYVSRCRNEGQIGNVFEHAGIAKPPVLDYRSYDTAMETEDDACDYSAASHYSNNDSVVLEALLQGRLQSSNRLQEFRRVGAETGTLRRRNRKRCNSDISQSSRPKKFREGSGKDRAYSGTANTKDHGLATVSYKSEAQYLDTTDCNLEQSMITSRSCCWSANGHNLLNNSGCEHSLNTSRHISIDNNIEYENILFQTHGCSLYQLHRLQLVGTDPSEAEF